ncbi:N-6 DNA methylase [Streptomyces sp. NPDC050636]|uniref:N-6 DNA methylase n=1 Tax=Streptomyces sp. NPDC050636 TaxID=3154510 RepID=UPI0034486C05
MTHQLDLFASLQPEMPAEAPTVPTPAPTPVPAAFTATETTTPVRPQQPRRPDSFLKDPSERAFQVGEAVANAWNKQHGGTHIEVPIGLVAALALIRQKDANGPDLGRQILAQDDRQLITMYREIWSVHWIHRPDLIDRARILHEWLNDEPEPDRHRMYVVRMVTKAALERGLFDITGHADPYVRSQADVLSPTLTLLRSLGAQQGLGEYHTPPPVTDTIAEAVIGSVVAELQVGRLKGIKPNEHVHDPASGTGGMLRSAAQLLRREGLEPADYRWSMVDIGLIAAACAAVNCLVWGLGPNVTVACDDSLANPNAVEDAIKHARAVIEHRDQILGTARMVAAVRQAEQLLNQVAAAA